MKNLSLNGVLVTSPSQYFRSIKKQLKNQNPDTLLITYITDDAASAFTSWPISHGWLNILEDAIEQGEQVEADCAIIIHIAQRQNDLLPLADYINDLSKGLLASGIWVKDSFLFESNHYFSYMCAGRQCCPAEGHPILDTEKPLFPTETLIERSDKAWKILTESTTPNDNTECDSQQFIQLIQDVRVRDIVLARIVCSEDNEAQLVEKLMEFAQSAITEKTPRIAGMASAAMAAIGKLADETQELLNLAGEDSLAQLIKTGIDKNVPQGMYRKIFAEALEPTLELTHQPDKVLN